MDLEADDGFRSTRRFQPPKRSERGRRSKIVRTVGRKDSTRSKLNCRAGRPKGARFVFTIRFRLFLRLVEATFPHKHANEKSAHKPRYKGDLCNVTKNEPTQTSSFLLPCLVHLLLSCRPRLTFFYLLFSYFRNAPRLPKVLFVGRNNSP